ncbi:hypothetical protein POJ06DRAFT_272954 [Lipomyces tetrasporus]|uniref:Uncharacterized protein n=1 Tax=Lipomyces tetrasporus TaxID=54092 RepID=A0AAD7QZZ2_9ASCO|nr:uncharacterized protein POJ06DRAFT_272954 [Lipomyces tetrasporus]KAJ8104343.1 hypothetical protein POJ06DRAFT_272954 [Lipomyces tetrasporus]
MSLIDGEPDRRSYASVREAAQRSGIKSTRISTTVTAKKDTVQNVTAKVVTVEEVSAEEDPMESEISEVLKILRGPRPSDSVLEFIVSEDGYKKIIEEREKSSRKVSYDGKSRTAIICFPTLLHEEAGGVVIDSMVNEVVRMLQNAGVGDDVTSRIRRIGHPTVTDSSSKRSYKEPDGLIIFDDGESDNAFRIVLEVGFSQTYASLKRACLWWIEQGEAPVVVSLCLKENHKSSGAATQVFRTAEERDAQKQRYIDAFNTQRRQEHRPLGPLVYSGYTWFGTLRDAFFETYRETDSGVVKSEPVYLIKDGVDVSDEISRDLSAIKVCDFVPHNWLSDNDFLRHSAVNFLRPQTFMQMMSNAIFRTALNRVKNTFALEE